MQCRNALSTDVSDGAGNGAGVELTLLSVPAAMSDLLATPQTATARFRAGRITARAKVSVTPAGLLAIGGLVASILLAVPPIIRAAGDARHSGHPDGRSDTA
jgi:hypothetical protein